MQIAGNTAACHVSASSGTQSLQQHCIHLPACNGTQSLQLYCIHLPSCSGTQSLLLHCASSATCKLTESNNSRLIKHPRKTGPLGRKCSTKCMIIQYDLTIHTRYKFDRLNSNRGVNSYTDRTVFFCVIIYNARSPTWIT